MTKGLLFWILMIIWLLFSGWLLYRTDGAWVAGGGTLLEFILFLLVGWQVFGPPLK